MTPRDDLAVADAIGQLADRSRLARMRTAAAALGATSTRARTSGRPSHGSRQRRPRDEGLARGAGARGRYVVFLLALTTTTTLWDRDEPRFAQAAVEMLASGQYLVPTFNGELRPQKPILIYWLMTLSLGALGKSELAVRMWSPIAIAVAALATFAIGRRWWSPRVGLVAMVIVALTPLTLVEGVAATTDAVLLASITVAMAIVAQVLDRPRWWHAAALGVAFGAGLLTKGPVAVILRSDCHGHRGARAPRPVLAGRVVACWWWRRCSASRSSRHGPFRRTSPRMGGSPRMASCARTSSGRSRPWRDTARRCSSRRSTIRLWP